MDSEMTEAAHDDSSRTAKHELNDRNMISAICAVAKNENDYLEEWIDYHLSLGFNKIILYDNSNPGDETTRTLLEKYIKQGILKLIDYRGRRSFQLEAYNECYSSDCADWIAFIDIDEFITFSADSEYPDINEFLKHAETLGADAIALNWMTYGDNGLVTKGPGKVTERFKEPLPLDIPKNRHIKTIAKTGKGLIFKKDPHCMDNTDEFSEVNYIDDCLHKVTEHGPFKKPSYKYLYIRHFITKTIEEYIKNKINRGAADSLLGNQIYKVSLFYTVNKRTIEKRKIERKLLPLSSVMEMDFYMIKEYLKKITGRDSPSRR